MTFVAELEIPHMFTAYSEDLGYLKNNLHHYQYYCEKCEQLFSAAWGKISGAINYYERGANFKCPYCERAHGNHVAYINRHKLVPDKVRIAVKEFKKVITLEIYCNAFKFTNYLEIIETSYNEVFRFDISKQTTTFSNYLYGQKQETIELGNPFQLEIFSKSILRHFKSHSLANSEQKKDITRVLKTLRETVHQKLEKHLKYRISSMFVSPGATHGSFLLPVFNMAYRLMFPDVPNLPSQYREDDSYVRKQLWEANMLKSLGYMDRVIAMTRNKTDFITALTEVYKLPNKPLVRKILTNDPFTVNILNTVFSICSNYDYAIQIFDALVKDLETGINRWDQEGMIKFFAAMKPIYGESGIVRLITKAKESQTYDCIRLYEQLSEINKKALIIEKVRLRDIHDWMSLRHKKQTHKNLKFSVPEHIVKRLSMQSNRLKFFLPAESMQLLEAGHALHNCVASYGKNMKDNQLWVVLVADDNGKLVACLEIKGNELVQAKLDQNKCVSCDKELNTAIIAWAKDANIKIKTSDVHVLKEKIAIPA